MLKPARLPLVLLACLSLLAGCEITPRVDATATAVQEETEDGFVPLFNGKDLTGWTPKFTGSDAGVNYKDTFTVKDGLLTVDYSNWDTFNGEFGHLFYEKPFSRYILRVEYRFIGEQVNNGPGWAFMNSGVMFHGQSLESMGKDQDFPDSIEAQLLGQSENDPRPRPTANVCSPGTHYSNKAGEVVNTHCISSSSDTFRGDQWVTFELEVHGYDKIIHRVNGEVVFEYSRPELDAGNRKLDSGTISIQAESHSCQFRKIEIKVLEE